MRALRELLLEGVQRWRTTLRRSLLDAALTQNIGMARDQDSLSRQNAAPTEWQRQLIADHAGRSADTLHKLGLEDEDTLDDYEAGRRFPLDLIWSAE